MALCALAVACGGVGGAEGVVRAPDGPFVRSVDRQPAVVWAVGDGADGGKEAREVARLIARDRPHRVLYLGDVYEDGTAEEFARNFAPVYGALARRMAPTPGNHEWPNHTEGYDPYWARVHGRPTPAYYAFRAGGWQLLSLNSEAPHDEGSRQVRWLRARVRGRGTCRLAFWHRPRYSAGTRHGDQRDVEPLWAPLRGRAALVLNGHEHNMQRLRPRDGITELISGAGGRSLYGINNRRPDLAFGEDDRYGALRLELRAGRATYRFVASSGAVLDAGAVRCRTG